MTRPYHFISCVLMAICFTLKYGNGQLVGKNLTLPSSDQQAELLKPFRSSLESNSRQLVCFSVTLLPPIPQNSLVSLVRFESGIFFVKEYKIKSIRSILHDVTYQNSKTCEQSYSGIISLRSPMPLCIDKYKGDLRTTSTFKGRPGDKLIVTVSALDFEDKSYTCELTIEILCPYSTAVAYSGAFVNNSCISRGDFYLSEFTARNDAYVYRFPRMTSSVDVYYLELNTSKLLGLSNGNKSIMIVFKAVPRSAGSAEKSLALVVKRLVLSTFNQRENIVWLPIDKALQHSAYDLYLIVSAFTYAPHSAIQIVFSAKALDFDMTGLPYRHNSLKIWRISPIEGSCGDRKCLIHYGFPIVKSEREVKQSCESTGSWLTKCSATLSVTFITSALSVSLSESVDLKCLHSSLLKDAKINWRKDGQAFYVHGMERYDGTTGPTTTHMINFPIDRAEQQGYYSCFLKTIYGHEASSEKALVLIKDISYIKIYIIGGFEANGSGPGQVNEDQFAAKMNESLRLARINPIGRIIPKKSFRFNISKTTLEASVTIFSMNSTQRIKYCGVLQKFRSIMRGLLAGSMKVEIYSFDCCESEEINGIRWPHVLVNSAAEAPCPSYYPSSKNTSILVATRKCVWNSSVGAQWTKPNMVLCPAKSVKITSHKVLSLFNELVNISRFLSTASTTNSNDLEKAVSTIEKIANLENIQRKLADNVVMVASKLMDVNRRVIAKAQKKHGFSKRLVVSLQRMADKMSFDGLNVTIETKNIALGIVLKDTNSSLGTLLSGGYSHTARRSQINITSTSAIPESEKGQGALFIPATTMKLASRLANKNAIRVTGFFYKNAKLFPNLSVFPKMPKDQGKRRFNGHYREESSLYRKQNTASLGKKQFLKHRRKLGIDFIDSKIISGSIAGVRLQNLSEPEEIRLQFSPVWGSEKLDKSNCVYWDFDSAGGNGAWSKRGCRTDSVVDDYYSCRCNHMTNFAVLIHVDQNHGQLSKEESKTLSIITYIGCAVSFICLLLTLITFTAFRNLRRKQPVQIHIFLCISLMLTLTTVTAGLQSKDKTTCKIFATLIHFFVLSSFCWMAVEGVCLYLFLVKVTRSRTLSHLLRNSNLFCWGLPSIIVSATIGVTKMNAYGKEVAGTVVCIISGMPFYIAYLLPIVLIMAMNLIVLLLVFKSLMNDASVTKSAKMRNITKVRITFGCSLVMGTTWIVGLFAVGFLTFTFQVLFCVLNSLQGFFIFFFYCALSQDVRKEWGKCVGIDEEKDSNAARVLYQPTNSKGNGSKSTTGTRNGDCSTLKLASAEEMHDSMKVNGDSSEKFTAVLFNGKQCKAEIAGDEDTVLLHFKCTSSFKKKC